MYGNELNSLSNTKDGYNERRRALVYALNSSGRYHAYKEHVKKAVISVVRQRFINEANTKSQAELEVRYVTLCISY